MNILLLNQAFYPDVAASAQHLSDLALGLAEAGHAVTVLTGRRAYDDGRQRFAAREMWRGVRIIRVPSTGLGKGARWRRAVDFATFLAGCAWRLAWLGRFDAVVALTSPPLISVFGAALARARGSRFIYWVMDFNPDQALAAGWLRPGSLAARILERLSRFSLRHAHRIIALDRFMADRIAGKGISRGRIAIIPPWAQDAEVRYDPGGRERFRRAHGLEGRFVVMYSGNHSPCHPLDTVLDAAKRLARDRDVVFCFVGGGSEFRRIQAARAGGGMENVLCLPYQPLRELAGSLSAADLHVVVMGNAFVGTVHPCKIYNVLSVGAPIVYLGPPHLWAAAAHGETERLVMQILWAKQQAGAMRRAAPEISREFSRAKLLPELVREVTG